MAEVTCIRCGETREGLDRAPYPDELGEKIREHACEACWAECRNVQVMMINEYRLDLSDPRAQQMIEKATRDFFGFDEASG